MLESLFIERLRDVCAAQAMRPAVVEDGATVLTYDELWRLTTRVAERLRRRGVGPESVVAIALPRSARFVSTLLAAWHCGAAFVPLDVALPLDRLRFMVRDSGAALLITDDLGPATVDLGGLARTTWNDLTLELEQAENLVPVPLDTIGNASNLAWIIYTSGSTGAPVGVAVEQGGYIQLLDAQIEAFRLTPQARCGWCYSPSFDASLSDIGTALLSGAALCIETSGDTPFGSLEAIRAWGVTHIDLPPALLAVLDPAEAPDCLQTVIIGGEVCAPEVVRRWAARVRVVNVYGPTETTVCSSLCVCEASTWERPLLGRPLPQVEYRVVDDNLSDVQNGCAGELLIGGPCLARAYINQPERTAARFIVLDGRRFFRSGDEVRCDADGEYVFLGRIDRQFKLRGLRIEPEEIEAVLRSMSVVRRAAVVRRRFSAEAARPMLMAFLEADAPLDKRALRNHLIARLPAWMIPARFERLERLPLTPSGKPDLRRLEVMELCANSEPRGDDADQVPRDALELSILQTYRDVIGVASFDVNDDFRSFGGDSLSVVEIAAALAARGVSIAPSLIAELPTVAAVRRRLVAGGEETPADADRRSAAWLLDDLEPELERVQREVLQRADCSPSPNRNGSQCRRVLLTGATGFLGRAVARELLERTDDELVCLVRTDSDAAALHRLPDELQRHAVCLSSSDHKPRLSAVSGDLGQPDFGWSAERWRTFARSIDAVIHCAARVHLVESYEQLRSDNVVGTTEVLRFTAAGQPKHLYFASTLSVFVATDRNRGTLFETDDLEQTRFVYGGYAQSKWAAEMLVRRAGLPVERVDIFRFGLLTGDDRTHSPSHDLLTLTIRGLATLGRAPRGVERLEVDLTPVGFAAAAMAALADGRDRSSASNRADGRPATWHIANPEPLPASRLIRVLQCVRPEMRTVEPAEFLRQGGVLSSEGAAASLSFCRAALTDTSEARPFDLFLRTGTIFDMRHARVELERRGIVCPVPSEALVERFVRRILSSSEA